MNDLTMIEGLFIAVCVLVVLGWVVWDIYDWKSRKAQAGNPYYEYAPWRFWRDFHYSPLRFLLLDIPLIAAVILFAIGVVNWLFGG